MSKALMRQHRAARKPVGLLKPQPQPQELSWSDRIRAGNDNAQAAKELALRQKARSLMREVVDGNGKTWLMPTKESLAIDAQRINGEERMKAKRERLNQFLATRPVRAKSDQPKRIELTAEQLQAIKAEIKAGKTQAAVAAAFGLSRGKLWSLLNPDYQAPAQRKATKAQAVKSAAKKKSARVF